MPYYRFIVESWTNAPIEAEVELQKAIDLHAPLFRTEIQVTHRELVVQISPDQVGNNPGGDPWRFFVEGETNSPDWTRVEIEKAIHNYDLAAALVLEVNSGFVLMASPKEREHTVEDVESWLHENQQEQGG